MAQKRGEGRLPSGPEGVRALLGRNRYAFPDHDAEVTHLIAEGDLVAPYKTVTGTDTGDVFGSRRREARHDPCMDFVRYRDGLVAEHWNVVDTSNVATA